jgi:ribosomal-protein-alanine N-acetyltransferase
MHWTPQMLVTIRTHIRPLVIQDAAEVFALESNEEVMRFQGGSRSKQQSYRALVAKIEHQKQYGFSMWAVIHSANGSFMGLAGLYHMTPTEVDMGWRFHKKYWNQNFAFETGKEIIHWGFLNTSLRQIVAVARPENVASNRVITKLGLTFLKVTTINDKIFNYYFIAPASQLK